MPNSVSITFSHLELVMKAGLSSKKKVTHLYMVTRTDLIVKIEYFSPKNGDEIGARHPKICISHLKLVTKRISPSKKGLPRPKLATREGSFFSFHSHFRHPFYIQ